MPDDPLFTYLQADTAAQLDLTLDPAYEGPLAAHLGAPRLAEYQQLARRLRKKRQAHHLGADAPVNLVFVPGVMGSLLTSRHLGGVSWIDVRTFRRELDHLRLGPDGGDHPDPRRQADPFQVDDTYTPFLGELLDRGEFGYEKHPYDWRKPLWAGTAALRDRVLRLHAANGGLPVHLVAHSMGGLLVRAALAEHAPALWPVLGKIVFLATPHYGSPAIAFYLKHHLKGDWLMWVLGRYLSPATFRTLWGPLSLLPAPRGVYPGTRPDDEPPWPPDGRNDPYPHPCVNFDPHRADEWHLNLDAHETGHLQAALNGAADFHRRLYASHLALTQEQRDRMAVIAGVGRPTPFRLARRTAWFDDPWEEAVKDTRRLHGDRHREGDGSVPLASAELEAVAATRYVRSGHQDIANVPAVYEDVFRWLKGEDLELPVTPAGALSATLGAETDPAPPADEPGGRWNPLPPSPQDLDELERLVDAGQCPDFERLRLL